MERGAGRSKYENCILTFAVMAVNVLLMGLFFDFYYDLNDDTLMHDIMSGIYTGTPDGHNMQTLYPLGALIALLYRICRPVPWYGLFLCLCQFGSLYLVGVRLCDMRDGASASKGRGRNFAGKLLWLALLSLFLWSVWLSHLINVQYTITCAMLTAAAIFLFLTTPDGLTARQFIVKNIVSVILALAAYALRTEMFLLAFPLVCLAGFYRLTAEKKIFDRGNLIRYGAVLGSILAGMLLLTAADYAAYGSREWKDFRRFFDARTTVYDFYLDLIDEEAYRGELTRLGVTDEQVQLLRNYNFGLDDAIDTRFMERLADYAKNVLGASRDLRVVARDALARYLYRATHVVRGGDAPYNAVSLWAYAAVLAAGFAARRGAAGETALRRCAFVWQLALLALVRSALWLFILFRGRDPERITHSLYLLEFALLAAMFARAYQTAVRGNPAGRFILLGSMTALFALAALTYIPRSAADMCGDQSRRAKINEDWYAIDEYCRAHERNYYFEDVYSIVPFSRYMFAPENGGCANYDYLGGWNCRSPLYEEKLARFGIESAAEALLDRGDVYLIVSRQECDGVIRMAVDHYGGQGVGVRAEQADVIGEQYCVLRFVQTAEESGVDRGT